MGASSHQVVVIGGGSAGLTIAFGAAAAGIDVGLVERSAMGGECTWRGCVPSKTLLDVARRAHEARSGTRFGLRIAGDVEVDLRAVMEHIHGVSHRVAADEDESALRQAGVTVYQAEATFRDSHSLQLDDGRTVEATQIVIATGGSPNIPGELSGLPHLTSDTIWALETLPSRLVIVGGGPIGTELGQAFRRLGSEVAIVTYSPSLLAIDDARTDVALCPHAGDAIGDVLVKEGVELMTGMAAVGGRETAGGIEVELEDGSLLAGSHLLIAAGQLPNLDGLGLEAAGVMTDGEKVVVDRYLRTSQRHIYACGDIVGAGFTHVAGAQAAGVLVNLVSPRPFPVDDGPFRWACLSDPEVAQVGLSCAQARKRRRRVETTMVPIERSDRAITQGASEGFLEIVHTRGGKILGATAVGPNAAEWANQWIAHLGKRMSSPIFTPTIYPTMGSVNAVMAYLWANDKVRTTRLGRAARRTIGRWMAWRGNRSDGDR